MLLNLLFLIIILNVKAFLGGALQLLAIELLQLLHCILIDWVHHVKDLKTLLAKRLEEGRGGDLRDALTGDVIDVVLALLHAVNVLYEADLLIARLGSAVSHELRNLGPIRRVFMDAKLDV